MSINHLYWLVPVGFLTLFWGGLTGDAWKVACALIGLVLFSLAVRQRRKEQGQG